MNKILIVDDLARWVTMHRAALKYNFGAHINIDSANSAKKGYQCLIEQKSEPYDTILVDMEMEDDFCPLYAGEWLIKQIQELEEYATTRIFIVSSSPNIEEIAEKYGVDFLSKDKCKDITEYELFLNPKEAQR